MKTAERISKKTSFTMVLICGLATGFAACSGDKNNNSPDDPDDSDDAPVDTASDADSDGDGDADTATDPSTDSDEAELCDPGTTLRCDCASGVIGVSRCIPDGSAWTVCECPVYGLNLFVDRLSPGGDGSVDAPLESLHAAQQHVRSTIAADGVPEDGIAVWIRGGVYELAETVTLSEADSGTPDGVVTWRGYPGENVRITGGISLAGDGFVPVTETDPAWPGLDETARDKIVRIDLNGMGVGDYGALERRGFCGERGTSPVELFFNGTPMTLARWPDVDEGVPPLDPTGNTIEIFGELTPDVTGIYQKTGTNDDVSVFARDGLVDGQQFYLYRHHWEYNGTWHRAWFLTTDAAGYPTNNGSWWSVYTDDLSPMNPANGASGKPLFISPDALRNGFAYIRSAESDTVWTYGGDRPSRWRGAEDIWFHGWWEHAWADCRIPAASLDTATRTVTLADTTGYGILAGQPYYAFNLLEEITRPGEYVLERATGMLYFYPPGPMDDALITLSVLSDPLIDLSNAAHIAIRDLTLEAGRGSLVRINGGNDNVLDGVTLRNSGGRGITISGTRNGVRNCIIRGTATTGVVLSGGDRVSLTPAGNFVENCRIHEFGRTEWTYRPAVSLSGVGHRIENNDMHDAPHSAILYGGNEHRIARNDIYRVCAYSSDAGAIYAGRDWGARGNVIENNFVHHIYSKLDGFGVHGIYLDDCLSGIRVEGNILLEIENHAIQHGGGRDNLMNNNIMVNCGDALSADKRGFDWRPGGGPNDTPGDSWNLLEKLQNVQYQAEPWAGRYPACAAIPDDWEAIIAPEATWLYPEGCTFERNLGFNNRAWMRGGDAFDYYASIKDNVSDADPLFVDAAALNMALLPGSPAFSIPGFVEIPFAGIGIQNR